MINEVYSFQGSVGNIHGKKNLSVSEGFSIPNVDKTQKGSTRSVSEKSAELLSIAKEYDITNISPNRFIEMGEKLYKGGHISGLQFVCVFCAQDLMYNHPGLLVGDPDIPINYSDYYKDQLERGMFPNRTCLENTIKNFKLVEKLADLHKQAKSQNVETLNEIQTSTSGYFLG